MKQLSRWQQAALPSALQGSLTGVHKRQIQGPPSPSSLEETGGGAFVSWLLKCYSCSEKHSAASRKYASSSSRSLHNGRPDPESAGPRSCPRGSALETGSGGRTHACGCQWESVIGNKTNKIKLYL